MGDLFNISIDWKILIVSGFVGHFIVSIGKYKYDNFERIISVFIYGTLGSTFFTFVSRVSGDWLRPKPNADIDYLLWSILITLAGSILSAAIWVWFGRNLISKTAGILQLYHDDHEASAYDTFNRSICSSRITFVDIYTTDGWIFRSDHEVVVNKEGISSDRWIAFNHDGVSMYVTESRDPSKKRATKYSAEKSMLTYIPMNEIRRMRVF